MIFPFPAPYTIQTLTDWCELHRPQQIGMSDNQYAWLAEMMRANVLTFNAIPIIFLDVPQT